MNIKEIIQASISTKEKLLADQTIHQRIEDASEAIVDCYKRDGKVLLCGNGGSAADAQHIAAEFSGRFYYDRPPLFAEALHVNTSYMTAVANDYSFDEVYARYVKAAGRKGDVLIGLSTSGNSGNVLKAMQAAKDIGMTVVAMTGEGGGKMKDIADILLNMPSSDTPRIQESHILVGHIICEWVERSIFPKDN
ncbi:MAG: phosphoheptose isomerase [Salinivirgaceae bacterium]|nr:MAG: phosphoheptose isomerase [Salinivirgaceae bacterium]